MALKFPSNQKHVLLIGCLTFTVQSLSLFSRSSNEGRKFLCAHFKSEIKTYSTSMILFQCQIYTSMMRKLEASNAHTLRMDLDSEVGVVNILFFFLQ